MYTVKTVISINVKTKPHILVVGKKKRFHGLTDLHINMAAQRSGLKIIECAFLYEKKLVLNLCRKVIKTSQLVLFVWTSYKGFFLTNS